MNEKDIQKAIEAGRNIMKYSNKEEFSDYKSDQALKKPQPPLVKAPMRETSIELPTDFDAVQTASLTELLKARKSSRVYTEDKMTLLQLSYLLWATQGIKEIRGKSYATLRTVPSGGARHPFETYLMVNKVEGLQPGRYHYLPWTHSLEFLGEVEDMEASITESLSRQAWARKSAVVFYWSFVAYRSEWRYGIHAHRPVLIDAGHVGENLYLAATALKLGCCAIAAFDRPTCDAMFELDGEEEFVIYTTTVGCVSEEDKEAEQSFYAFVKKEGL